MRRLARVRAVAVAFAFALGGLPWLGAGRAWGASGAPTSVVVGGRTGHAPASDVVHRILGELAADRLDVSLDCAVPSDDPAVLARIGHASGAALVAYVLVAEDGLSIDLIVVDTVTGRSDRRRLNGDPPGDDNAREVLARRTADLVRATLLEFAVEGLRIAEAQSAPQRVASAPIGRLPQPNGPRPTFGMGAVLLASPRGVAAAFLPVLRVGASLLPPVWVHASVAGLGTRPTVSTPEGTAAVEQTLALVEVGLVPWRTFWIRPQLVVGMGAYFVRAQGSAAAPYIAADPSTLAFACEAGGGFVVPVASHLDLLGEATSVLTFPGVAVHVAGADEVRLGRPALVTTVALSVTL